MEPVKVCIEVRGGCVISVYADRDVVDIHVLDWDNILDGQGWGDTVARDPESTIEAENLRRDAIEAERVRDFPLEVY